MASSPSYIPYLCVAAAAFITTFLAVPLVKRLAIKLDAVDYPSKRRINTKPIPRLGGTAVFLGLAVWVQNPIVSCPAELQLRFTPEMRQEAVALKKGFVYFPFFTAKITVKDIQEDGVVMIESLYLFALASDEVAFGGPDGPEVVEKLNLIW